MAKKKQMPARYGACHVSAPAAKIVTVAASDVRNLVI
jgi:hypothetical protein